MKAEIISIGTEILLGHIVNTNASYISEKLAEHGIDVYYHTTVGDNHPRLIHALKTALGRCDIVITSGGLGPTVDDITTSTVATLIGKPLILDRKILKGIKEYFKIRKHKFPPECVRQAYIPEGTKLLKNHVGTAPGLIIAANERRTTNDERRIIICLPGPPREIVPMFEHYVIPYIKKMAGGWILKSRTIKTTGLAESKVNGMVKDLLNLKPPTTVGIYAKLKEVHLKIMAKAENEKAANQAIKKIEKKIHSRLKDYIFGYDDETLEDTVAKVLFKENKTIAVAESCTGGFVSNRLTNVSGSSKYFKMGIVAYSNEMKEDILGVSRELIKKDGAVSGSVALEMARSVKFLARTDIGIGITGIAGPTGGTKSKPVGLVYITLVTGNKRLAKEYHFKGSRSEIKFQASQAALDLIRKNT